MTTTNNRAEMPASDQLLLELEKLKNTPIMQRGEAAIRLVESIIDRLQVIEARLLSQDVEIDVLIEHVKASIEITTDAIDHQDSKIRALQDEKGR